MNELLIAENICYKVEQAGTFQIKKTEKEILKDVSFKLEKGKILGIAGESGSGKTTLAKIISGVVQYSSGKIIFNKSGEWEKIKTSPVQILFQNNGEILNPLRRINDIVEEAIVLRYGNKIDVQKEKEKIFGSLNFPGQLWERKGFELSGGEQQRAALARILAVKPELLILDEPFSAQDPESQLNLLNLFKNINEEFGIAMICIAHNLKILQKLCGNILIMYKGEIVEQGKSEKIFNTPEHPYTKFLLKAESYNLTYQELSFDAANAD
ncbi:MAG: ATP-binding cassette domain-containing protein [Bacteroidetes bacterium]|nr:ATP-binding cassette domain-containing protein [Bacteroidota bacterium]